MHFAVRLLPLVCLAVPSSLPSGPNNDCASGETFFGACLPGQSCPPTCPQGCHCTAGDSCCYPSSSTQNNFLSRVNAGPNAALQTAPAPSSPSDSLNTMLASMLFMRQQGAMPLGGQCQDRAWNCVQFAPLCLSSSRMLSFCPVTCGLCPNPLLAQQMLLQMVLGGGQPQQGQFGGNENGLGGRIQGWLNQAPAWAGAINNALGAFGGTGLNVQSIAQALGQRFGLGR